MIGGNEEYGLTVARGIYPAYVLGGHAYVAVDDAGDVVGTLAWFPPGRDFLCESVIRLSIFMSCFARIKR